MSLALNNICRDISRKPPMSSAISKAHIVIIGCGVIGLTTGCRALEQGHDVTILASTLPSDEKSIHITSHWAGGHHVSHAGKDKRQQDMDMRTFKMMWKLSEQGHPASNAFLRVPQTEYFAQEMPNEVAGLSGMPNFRLIEKSKLPEGVAQGVTFDTLTFDPKSYLEYLMRRFTTDGGVIRKTNLQHITQVQTPLIRRPASAIIVCAGLGARNLGGVEDKKVYPIRGTTVIVRNPEIRFGITMRSEDGTWTYIIPRPDGTVVLGGYKTAHDWTTTASPIETEDILTRAVKLCPQLISSDAVSSMSQLRQSIVEEGCGLRPAREGGIRIGYEIHSIGKQRMPIVFHYGHGGYGFQSSWGSADYCMSELENALKSQSRYSKL